MQVANGLLSKHLAVLPLASTVRTKELSLRLFALFLSYVELNSDLASYAADLRCEGRPEVGFIVVRFEIPPAGRARPAHEPVPICTDGNAKASLIFRCAPAIGIGRGIVLGRMVVSHIASELICLLVNMGNGGVLNCWRT